MSADGLTIAVPRGALFEGTLDLLDALGIDTAEVRSNDRKLLFEDAGIVTMRPERRADLRRARRRRHRHHRQGRAARAAEREVYELLDLGFGRCEMVVAAREGDDALGEALRRLRPRPDRDQVPADRRRALRRAPAARPRSSRSRDRSSWRR